MSDAVEREHVNNEPAEEQTEQVEQVETVEITTEEQTEQQPSSNIIDVEEEGTVAEPKLDFTLCPENYLPLASTDTPAKTPQGIALANSDLSTKSSQFSKVIISRSYSPSELEETEDTIRQLPINRRSRTDLLINNNGGYAASTTAAYVYSAALAQV